MTPEYAVLSPKEAIPKAEAAANKALELDNTLAEAHSTLGYAKGTFDWALQGAKREYKQAIELNPSYANAHHWYAAHLGLMATLGYTYAVAARRDEAIKIFNELKARSKRGYVAAAAFAFIHAALGDQDQALRLVGKGL